MGKNEKGFNFRTSSNIGILVGIISFAPILMILNILIANNASFYALIISTFISALFTMIIVRDEDFYIINEYGDEEYYRGDNIGAYNGFVTSMFLTVIYLVLTKMSVFNDFFLQMGISEEFNGLIFIAIITMILTFLIFPFIGMLGGYIGAKIRKSVNKPLI